MSPIPRARRPVGGVAFDAALGVSACGWAVAGLLDERGGPLAARAVAAGLNATVGLLFIVRAPAAAEGTKGSILRALPSALVAGLAWRLAPAHAWPPPALVLFACGGTLAIASLVSLGRSFSIFPALRGVTSRGPYGVVRHPAYLGEIAMVGGIGLAAGPIRGAVLAGLATLLCIPRILDEEALLARDASYAAYCRRVPRRLVPGLW